jgi:hypothetical protein
MKTIRYTCISLLSIICFIMSICLFACNPKYSYFEVKSNDIRLRDISFPLFSLEYPKNFLFQNSDTTSNTISTPESTFFYFTGFSGYRTGTALVIQIQKIGAYGFSTSNEKFSYIVSKANGTESNYTTSRDVISGLSANIMEAIFVIHENASIGEMYYTALYRSLRTAVFEYSGLIWEISLSCYYVPEEPSQMKNYFDHVITTFKFLEK